VGKIYNVLAHKIAREIHQNLDGAKEVYVLLLSRIGTPIDRPQMAAVQILTEKGIETGDLEEGAKEILAGELAEIGKVCTGLARGEYPIC
jgi:S-adenosylmethionine synthetase